MEYATLPPAKTKLACMETDRAKVTHLRKKKKRKPKDKQVRLFMEVQKISKGKRG